MPTAISSSRSPDLGVIPGLASSFGAEWALAMWERACFARAFEMQVAKAKDGGRIPGPVYLSIGQEFIAAGLSMIAAHHPLFAQHRAHSHFLCRGGDPERLRDELLGRETGCAAGMGGSASIHDRTPSRLMFGHSGLMGDQGPIAVGYALATGKPVICVLGDASAEEDYVLGALGYAATKRAPVLFIIEDNDLSILTRTSVRRSWTMEHAARGFGLRALSISDDPWTIAFHAEAWADNPAPTLINVRTCRDVWHAGTGRDGDAEWDRVGLVADELAGLMPVNEFIDVRIAAKDRAKELWEGVT